MFSTYRSYQGSELTVYSSETPVVFEPTIHFHGGTKVPTEPTFVRATAIDVPAWGRRHHLLDVLKKTDEELETVARYCGASVIKHAWGLYPAHQLGDRELDRYLPRRPDRLGMPEDHILVAKVPFVTATEGGMSSETISRIQEGLQEYYAGVTTSHKLLNLAGFIDKLSDFRDTPRQRGIDQFTVGTTTMDEPRGREAEARTLVMDIEPRFEYFLSRFQF